jgi:hypothetical protein
VSINHPYNNGSNCGELSASSERHLNSMAVDSFHVLLKCLLHCKNCV